MVHSHSLPIQGCAMQGVLIDVANDQGACTGPSLFAVVHSLLKSKGVLLLAYPGST